MSRTTYIYFIQPVAGGLIKIGRADDPEQRLKNLQCGSPVKLRLCSFHEAPLDMETRLHLLFSRYREHGEWFKPCPLLAGIAGAIADPDISDDDVTPDNEGSPDFAFMTLRLPIIQAEARGRQEARDRERADWTDADWAFSKIQYDPITSLPRDADPSWSRGQRVVS